MDYKYAYSKGLINTVLFSYSEIGRQMTGLMHEKYVQLKSGVPVDVRFRVKYISGITAA